MWIDKTPVKHNIQVDIKYPTKMSPKIEDRIDTRYFKRVVGWFMVFNATFNNISVIPWW